MPPKEEKSLSEKEIKEKNLAYLQEFKEKLGISKRDTPNTSECMERMRQLYCEDSAKKRLWDYLSKEKMEIKNVDSFVKSLEETAKSCLEKNKTMSYWWTDLFDLLWSCQMYANNMRVALKSLGDYPENKESMLNGIKKQIETDPILKKFGEELLKWVEDVVKNGKKGIGFYVAWWGLKLELIKYNAAIAAVTEKLTGQSCDLGLGDNGRVDDRTFDVNMSPVQKCAAVLGIEGTTIGELIKKNPSKADTIATNIDTISKMEKDMEEINGKYTVAENSKRTLANKHKEVFFLKKAKVGACEDLGITKDALTIDEKKVIDASKELEDIVSIENIKSSEDLKRVGPNSLERLKKCYKELLKRLDAVLRTNDQFQNIINKNEGLCTPENVVKVVRIVRDERLSNDVVNVWLGFIDNWKKTRKSDGFSSYSDDEYNVIDYLVPTNVNRAKMLMATLKSLEKMPENGEALMTMLKKELDKHEILKSYREEILSWLERFLKLPGNGKEDVTGVLLRWMHSLELFIINAGMLNVVKELGVNVDLKVTDEKEKIKECLETKLKDNPVMKCIGLTANEFKGLFEDNMDAALLLASNLRTAGEYINLPERIGKLDNENKKIIVDDSGHVFELKQEGIKWNKNAVMEYKSDEFKNYLEKISKSVPDLKQNQVNMSSLVEKIEHENIKGYYVEYYKEKKVPDDAVGQIEEQIEKINSHHKSINETLGQLEKTYSAIKESNFHSAYLSVGKNGSPPNEGLKELNGKMTKLTKKIRGES